MKIREIQRTTLSHALGALEPPDSYLIEDDLDGTFLSAPQLLKRYRFCLNRSVVMRWFEHPLDQGEVAVIFWAADTEDPQEHLAFRVIDLLTIESLETWLKGQGASEIVGTVGGSFEDEVLSCYLRRVVTHLPGTLEDVPRATWLVAYHWLLRCLASSSGHKEIRCYTALAVLELLFTLQQDHFTLLDKGSVS